MSALTLLLGNLIGHSIGPLIVGGVSLALARSLGEAAALGWGMAALQLLSAAGLIAYYWAGRQSGKRHG